MLIKELQALVPHVGAARLGEVVVPVRDHDQVVRLAGVNQRVHDPHGGGEGSVDVAGAMNQKEPALEILHSTNTDRTLPIRMSLAIPGDLGPELATLSPRERTS